ncbi:MAG: Selenide, water dikinase [Fimbriimonadaceae bacterium]|nr:Selenide, water dikinase [Fimbriimonadaceae bacterium]
MNPNLLVGFDHKDDAGVFRLPNGQALVQTVDFFTPIVDDPYAYGAIAAANALSDVYAMGGTPLTVLNIACFDPTVAPAEVWAAVLTGAFDKTVEAGAVVVGGHSVEDKEPKFGMAVTGVVDPERMFVNTGAKPGDRIFLTKPLGSGIVTTAAMNDVDTGTALEEAIAAMSTLNRGAMEAAHAVGSRCATDITGFGLAGHLYNIAAASGVRIEISADKLPHFSGIAALVEKGAITGGAMKTRTYLDDRLEAPANLPNWYLQLALDPQTSGGLAIFSVTPPSLGVEIGRVTDGSPVVALV